MAGQFDFDEKKTAQENIEDFLSHVESTNTALGPLLRKHLDKMLPLPEVDFAIRFHDLGLLPEDHCKGFVSKVMSYAIDGEDLHVLESLRIQSVFTSTELIEFRGRVRTELVLKLEDVRRTWQSNHNSDERPDEYMEPLLSSFSDLKEEFIAEPEILGSIDREIQRMHEWISENKADDSKEDRTSRVVRDVDAQDLSPVQLHGIFDDVDE